MRGSSLPTALSDHGRAAHHRCDIIMVGDHTRPQPSAHRAPRSRRRRSARSDHIRRVHPRAGRTVAAKLHCACAPGLEHVFFSDSGSTSVEVALKMALGYWRHTRRAAQRIIVHGTQLPRRHDRHHVGRRTRAVQRDPMNRCCSMSSAFPFPPPVGRRHARGVEAVAAAAKRRRSSSSRWCSGRAAC